MKNKEEKFSHAEKNKMTKLTDDELEKVSGGATIIKKKDVLSEDGVAKPDVQSILKN